jgi:hypothetical protein
MDAKQHSQAIQRLQALLARDDDSVDVRLLLGAAWLPFPSPLERLMRPAGSGVHGGRAQHGRGVPHLQVSALAGHGPAEAAPVSF